MAAVNYYLGVRRDAANNPNLVANGTATVGTAADVEVRIQINDGSTATGIKRKDVVNCLKIIKEFIESGGTNHSGANLPAL